jgi:RNA-directed DNA polymerase
MTLSSYTKSHLPRNNWHGSRNKLEAEGLRLNEAKTRLVNMRMQRSEFDFLGIYLQKCALSFGKKGHWYVKVQPSKKSQKKFKDAIRQIVKHRTSKRLYN